MLDFWVRQKPVEWVRCERGGLHVIDRSFALGKSHMSPDRLRDLTIVVVEDHDDARRYLGLFLKQIGANVVLARNGFEGLEATKNNRPDLVVSDIGVDPTLVSPAASLNLSNSTDRRCGVPNALRSRRLSMSETYGIDPIVVMSDPALRRTKHSREALSGAHKKVLHLRVP